MTTMKTLMTLICAVLCLAVSPYARAQDAPGAVDQESARVRKLFEAGQHEQVIEAAAAPGAMPSVLFAAALSQQKLGALDQAKALYRRLGELPEDNAWHFIGRSGQQLIEGQSDAALDSARRAVSLADASPDAHQQLGLVLARRQAWTEAAAAFDRAAQIDPLYAYAYYYGGLMHYRANRPDLMAVRFERFLKLAPEAPERPAVLQIMRTIRGR